MQATLSNAGLAPARPFTAQQQPQRPATRVAALRVQCSSSSDSSLRERAGKAAEQARQREGDELGARHVIAAGGGARGVYSESFDPDRSIPSRP